MDILKEDIKGIIADLNERKKELDCLYEVNNILKNSENSIETVIYQIIELMPAGWQHSEICKVQVILDGKTYSSENLKITELKQSAKIKFDNTEIGEINIYYIKAVKTVKNPIFLYEEQKLLNNIASEISLFITLRKLRDLLNGEINISTKLKIPLDLSKWLSKMQLSDNEMEGLLKTKINFKKGETIFKQGTFASYIVLITKGLSKAFIEDINERSFTFKIIKPYEIVGLSSLFGDGYYGFSCTAITNTEGYLIDKDTIINIIENNIKFNFELLKWYGVNFQMIYEKMNCLANKQALGKVASTLLYLSNNIFHDKIIDTSIARKTIAELSGMSTENAVRILSELKNDGIIHISKMGIKIIHHDLLKTFSIAG